MKFLAFISLVLAFTTPSAHAFVERTCKVEYETNTGWSDGYTLQVQFYTGKELNRKTKSYKYVTTSNYALVWFSENEVAILKLQQYMMAGEDFDSEDFRALFRFSSMENAQQVNGDRDTKWRITGKTYSGFIDPRENDESRLY